jgi:hypothetical protein
MDMRPGLVRRAHQAERLTPSPHYPSRRSETLLILVVALGVMIRGGMAPAAHNDWAHAGCELDAR